MLAHAAIGTGCGHLHLCRIPDGMCEDMNASISICMLLSGKIMTVMTVPNTTVAERRPTYGSVCVAIQ